MSERHTVGIMALSILVLDAVVFVALLVAGR